MEKRTFLKTGLMLGMAAAFSPLIQACKTKKGATADTAMHPAPPTLPSPKMKRTEPFTLPALPFEPGGLEPNIDKMTMEIHHGKHHAGYVSNLNEAVKGTVYAEYTLEDILPRITASDADKKIRNNAGGHWNHSFFWQSLYPGMGSSPGGPLADAINKAYGSFDLFKETFAGASKGVFGSGWTWLCKDNDGKLFITTTPNQDNPLMLSIVKQSGTPLLGLDVWEHAYYLKYQNRRPEYITAFFNVINWKEVMMRYDK